MTWKPTCTREGCDAPLGWGNRSGHCRKHQWTLRPRVCRKGEKRNPAALKAYRLANAEKIRAYNREYYLAHKIEVSIRTEAWAKANPEKVTRYKRKWDAANPEARKRHTREAKRRERANRKRRGGSKELIRRQVA